MKFMEAVNFMESGKKVRRKCWDTSRFINLSWETLFDNKYTYYEISVDDVLGKTDDWEEYEDNWNLKDAGDYSSMGPLVTKLQQKILDDVRKMFKIEHPTKTCKRILEHRIIRIIEKRFGF